MTDKPRYTFHLTPEQYFSSLDPSVDYLPPEFDLDGFIHCTDGAANMAATANSYYRHDGRSFLLLCIDKTLVRSPVRYEDPAEIYPHIYGPLNRDAIVSVRPAVRLQNGSFPDPGEQPSL